MELLSRKKHYILEGNGRWIIEDEEYEVKAKDIVIILPCKWLYFKGKLKQICIKILADKKNTKNMLDISNKSIDSTKKYLKN